MHEHVPSELSRTRHHLPWIDFTLKCVGETECLAKLGKPTAHAYGLLTGLFSHTKYLNEVVGGSLQDNPKTFWSYVHLMKTENINIPPLKLDGKLHATDPAKATALNSQFKSVFNVEDSSNIPNKGSSPYPDINHLVIGLEGVAKQFNNINPNKASGPDELPARLLKTVSSEIAPLMQFLFQQSYNQGCVPEDWNKAIVTAIHKKGPKWDPGNYRPISLTCLVCKVMEHVVLSHVAKHLAAYNILLDSQHGFREKLSTQTQLITSVHDWATTLNNRGQCDLVLLDFSKAFDMVPHRSMKARCQVGLLWHPWPNFEMDCIFPQ